MSDRYRPIRLSPKLFAAALMTLCTIAPAHAAKPVKVTVTEAIPNEGEQGVTGLVVTVKGANFAPGATVKFLKSGTKKTAGIVVTSVTVIDAETIDTTIDIESTAFVGGFDIEVRLSGGGRGKGTELFQVASQDGPHFHLYDVTITGDVSGSGVNWEEDSGNDWVLFKNFYPEATGSLDLSYFVVPSPGGPFTGDRGEKCFGDGFVPRLFQVILGAKRRTGAYAAFWFFAYTDDGLTEVVYRLELSGGTFDHPDDWPPLALTSMEVPSWTVSLDNAGAKIKNVSCLGKGNFVPPIVIDVVRTQ